MVGGATLAAERHDPSGRSSPLNFWKVNDVMHTFGCRCGTLKGTISDPRKAIRGICYCKDCQAYADFLGKAEGILDEAGGTDIVTVLQRRVAFTHGVEKLACMSLSERGALRWYAKCCGTPIGNTVRDFRQSFVGMVHSCLGEPESLTRSFGPVRMKVNTASARIWVQAMPLSTLTSAFRFATLLIRARIDDSYRHSPFFDSHRGRPVVVLKVPAAP